MSVAKRYWLRGVMVALAAAMGVAWWHGWRTRPQPQTPAMDWPTAVAFYREQAAANPKDAMPHLALGRLHYEAGQIADALREVQTAAALGASDPAVQRSAGNFHAHLGNMGAAIEHLGEATRLDPDDFEAWLALARAHEARGETPKAEEALTHAMALAGERADRHLAVGRMLHESADPERATPAFARAIEWAPEDPVAWFERGRLFLEGHNLDDAQHDLERAAELDPKSGRYQYYLGLVFLRRSPSPENLEAGEGHLREALELGGAHAGVYHALGMVANGQGRLDDAIRYFEQAVQLGPDSTDAHHALATALRKAERHEEAEAAMARFRRLKDVEAALKRATSEVEHHPDSAQAHHELAQVCEEQGRFGSALTHYQRAMELDPGHTEAKERFERLYGKVGSVPHLRGKGDGATPPS